MNSVETVVYVQADSIEAKQAACEVRIMRACTGMVLLEHALAYLPVDVDETVRMELSIALADVTAAYYQAKKEWGR